MSNVSKRRRDREGSRPKIKSMGDHREFLKRITKTLSYGQLPSLPCLSLPVTELSCELWSAAQRGRSLRRLHADAAAALARQACVSPCALVLAILYLERLRACNPHYLAATPPADLFLVSLMVGNKFLHDDGEDEEVICSEWAISGGMELSQLKKLEVEFLSAIDWKVFVNEKAFETGLQWLERQVGIRQGQARGFFTYSELAATGERELLAALWPSCVAAALGYVAALTALMASALLAAHCLASLTPLRHLVPNTSTPMHTHLAANQLTEPLHVTNSTVDLSMIAFILEESAADRVGCCAKWLRYRNIEKNRYESTTVRDRELFESWWSKISVLDWLYRSSLVDPLQRWLERINEYTEFFKREFSKPERCNHHAKRHEPQHCVWQRLNLSKLNAVVVSVSDR